MSTRTKRGFILGFAVAGVAVAFSAALILKAPGPGPVIAAADAESVAIATGRLEVALGVPRGTVKTTSDQGVIPGAVQSFEWSNGRAGMDASGKIVMVQQDPAAAWESGGPTLGIEELDRAADDILSLLGWGQAERASGGLKPGASRPLSHGTSEYGKTWDGYTSQDIPNGGILEVKLDSRDGRLVSFWYLPGVGDVKVDAASAIGEEKALEVASNTVRAYLDQQAQSYTGEDRALWTEYTIDVKSTTLKLTNAPGVTGGDTRLIWFIKLEGSNAAHSPVGGTVYIDALSGEVILYLPPA